MGEVLSRAVSCLCHGGYYTVGATTVYRGRACSSGRGWAVLGCATSIGTKQAQKRGRGASWLSVQAEGQVTDARTWAGRAGRTGDPRSTSRQRGTSEAASVQR